MTAPTLPDFRQVVLLTGDLEGALATARAALGVPNGFRDVDGMAKIGFRHEIFGFDHTYVEVCEPLDPVSGLGKKVAAKGDAGFMVVVQVADSAAMVDRAKALGIEPLFVKDHHGSPISQWHPRDFGTIAEFDQLVPADSWHFAPAVYDARSTTVVEDLVAVCLSVANPAEMAQRWATVLDATLEADGRSVNAGGRMIRFASLEDVSGVYAVECRAVDRGRVGTSITLCGVTFQFV